MTDPIDHLRVARRVAADLLELGASFAVVGGLACIAHSQVRTTKDVVFAIAIRGDDEAEQLVFGLRQRGYRPAMLLQQENGRLATVRMVTPLASTPDPDCDLLFATCGIEAEVVRGARAIAVDGGAQLPVAARAHLIAMKLLSESPRRPHDRSDLAVLLRQASRGEIADAALHAELIAARGFARGKDLLATLRGFLRDVGRDEVTV